MSTPESQSHLFGLAVQASKHATKTFRWRDGQTLKLESDYSAGSRFKFGALPSNPNDTLSDIEDLAKLIAAMEAQYPKVFFIRGAIRPEVPKGSIVNRRYHSHPNKSAPAWQMHPEGPRWLMIDLDDLAAPEGMPDMPDAGELTELVRYATSKLPPCFEGVTTFYQWSSSAGLEKCGDEIYRRGFKNLRLHLWYWLDRGGYCPALRKWLKSWKEQSGVPVDTALYNPVQPHFVAAPVFKGGSDIFADGTRSGLIRGERDMVCLPDEVLSGSGWREREVEREAERKARAKQARYQRAFQPRGASLTSAVRYSLAALDGACQTIQSAGVGNRHATINSQAYSIGGLVGGGHLQLETARAELEQAAFAALPTSRHREAIRTVDDGLKAGARSPREIPPSNRSPTSPARQPSAKKTPTPKPKSTPKARVLTDADFGSAAESPCSFPFGYNPTPHDTERKIAWKAYASEQTRKRYYNPDKDIELLSFEEWITKKSASESLAAPDTDTPNDNEDNRIRGSFNDSK